MKIYLEKTAPDKNYNLQLHDMKTSHGKSLAIVLLAVSCFYITACTDDNNSPPEEETIDLSCQERPDEPESFELDLNDDGVSDYEIRYGISYIS